MGGLTEHGATSKEESIEVYVDKPCHHRRRGSCSVGRKPCRSGNRMALGPNRPVPFARWGIRPSWPRPRGLNDGGARLHAQRKIAGVPERSGG